MIANDSQPYLIPFFGKSAMFNRTVSSAPVKTAASVALFLSKATGDDDDIQTRVSGFTA
jgi:hypothetical protein